MLLMPWLPAIFVQLKWYGLDLHGLALDFITVLLNILMMPTLPPARALVIVGVVSDIKTTPLTGEPGAPQKGNRLLLLTTPVQFTRQGMPDKEKKISLTR
jgi:hypothetical protein